MTTDPAAAAPPSGYRPFTKVLHWAMVGAIAAQFLMGYLLDVDDGGGRGRGRGRGGESGRGRVRGGDDASALTDDGLLRIHIALGMTILVLAGIRWWWRRRSVLPAWAPTLSARERTLAHGTEVALYVSMFAMPLTGLVLVLVTDEVLPLHVASHLLFLGALTLHVGLVLKHQAIDRDHLIRRMLPRSTTT
ncbi:cytochrome b [Aquihabitans daechungensis]|uniref:cytochrome b n=1 Tax=Aquihabitans daechungensis TaxID=1052257 RepID=UPI003B9F4237